MPAKASACFNRRTITRTASHSRELSLGSCIGAAVTVLSSRTMLPSSSFSRWAPTSTARLIASQVCARMALTVLCSTDFFGLHAHGSRAKARNNADPPMEGNPGSSTGDIAEQRAAEHRLRRQAMPSGLSHSLTPQVRRHQAEQRAMLIQPL